MLDRRNLLLAAGAGLAGATPMSALSQQPPWPTAKPVAIVVPFSAGGSADITARTLAERFRSLFGGTFIVENRAGATGNIGVAHVVKSPPDGYTLLLCTSGPAATNVLIYKKLPHDPRKDLTPIVLIGDSPVVILVRPDLPIRNIQDLVEYDRKNPNKLSIGHPGAGGMGHMVAEMLAGRTNSKFNYIPYPGSPPMTRDIMGGSVDAGVDLLSSVLPLIQAGRLRAIATSAATRPPELPDVPTVAEQGLTDFSAAGFLAMLGPAGLPQDIVMKINVAINDWIKTDEAKKLMSTYTMRPIGGTPEDLKVRMQVEIDKWGPVVKAAGLEVND
jgi:tripartite-type tricarboxylate transporter receptor subunit TctC